MGEMNQRALEYMVDRFSTALGEAAKAHTQEMTALLNEVSSSLTGLPTQLNTASSAFVAVIDDVTAQFKGGVQDSSTAIGEMATEIRSLTSEIRLSEQALAGHLSQAEKRVGTTIDHFGTLVEALEDAASTLQPLNEAGRQLGEGGATLLAGANELKAVAAQNSLSSERLAEAVESYKAGLAGLDERLGATFARIEAGLQKLDSRAEGAASVINADLGTELARLAEAVLTLQMVVKHRRVTEAAE
jgi:methyl-accepting chemotaxis protein